MAPARWWAAGAVTAVATLVLSTTWSVQPGFPLPAGVPPPAGDPVPAVDIHTHGRPADQLRAWADERATGMQIPPVALEAYAYAAEVAEVVNPGCHLRWPTLAGIGMVESHHGTYHGATLAPNGDVRPPIRGAQLDGTGDNMRIIDHLVSTETPTYAQAMGPMQFIPETWRLYGVDAHNDGVVDVDNIDDAALSAAGYLCYCGGDLATTRGWFVALQAYNHSRVYARAVRDWATAYAQGHPL